MTGLGEGQGVPLQMTSARSGRLAGARPITRIGPAELRTRRAASGVLGIAVLVYFATNLVAILEKPDTLTHWWWISALAGRLAFGIALAAMSWFVGFAVLRALALSFAIFGTVIVAASIPAIAAGMSETLRDQSLYALAAVLAFRPVWAWIWLLSSEFLAVVARMMRSSELIPVIESSLVSLTTTVLLVVILLAVLRAARARDRGEQAAREAIFQDVEQAAKAAERERIERIVHDDVLATLRAASLGISTDRVDPAHMADAALDRLQQSGLPSDAADRPHDAAALLNELRSLVTALAPEAEVHASISGSPEIPSEVASAIVEACREALRNSVRHAPPHRRLSRAVRVRITPHEIEVTIEDDGEGFDPRNVQPNRLGIASSIVGRMRALPGGDAAVHSAEGSGTVVSVYWCA
ncbi:MAG: sensor histidine kinase [Leucobacter sp.]